MLATPSPVVSPPRTQGAAAVAAVADGEDAGADDEHGDEQAEDGERHVVADVGAADAEAEHGDEVHRPDAGADRGGRGDAASCGASARWRRARGRCSAARGRRRCRPSRTTARGSASRRRRGPGVPWLRDASPRQGRTKGAHFERCWNMTRECTGTIASRSNVCAAPCPCQRHRVVTSVRDHAVHERRPHTCPGVLRRPRRRLGHAGSPTTGPPTRPPSPSSGCGRATACSTRAAAPGGPCRRCEPPWGPREWSSGPI